MTSGIQANKMTNIFAYKDNLPAAESFIDEILEIFLYEHTILETIRNHMTIEDGIGGTLRCIIDLKDLEHTIKHLLNKIIFVSTPTFKMKAFKCVELCFDEKIIFYSK